LCILASVAMLTGFLKTTNAPKHQNSAARPANGSSKNHKLVRFDYYNRKSRSLKSKLTLQFWLCERHLCLGENDNDTTTSNCL